MDSIVDYELNSASINGSWKNSNGLIVGQYSNLVKLIDPINEIEIDAIPIPEDVKEVSWLNQKEAIAIAPFGLYKVNFETKKVTKLRCQCPIKSYQKPRANPNGTKLTLTKCVFNQIGNTQYMHVKYSLVELNLSDLSETVVLE
jgi:hypothetical protein